MGKIITIILMLMFALDRESLKEKIIDITLSVSSALGVYHSIPLQMNNIWVEETIRGLFSIVTALIVLVLSLVIRHFWNKKFKSKKQGNDWD